MTRITSRDNARVKFVAKLAGDKAARRKEGLFVCEGLTMLAEALRSGVMPVEVFCEESQTALLPPEVAHVSYEVPAHVVEKLSDVKTPQGVVFTCPIPEPKALSGPQFLAVEELRDPGNAGTIVRTADAFGIGGVFLVGECADFYAPKVVRATMGSVFRVPVRAVTLEELRDAMTEQNIPLYAAALDARAAQISELSLSRACVLIGNEARGLSAQALALCDRAVYIPMRGAESLNAAVAASVFLWEMSKQQSVRGRPAG